MKTIWPYLCKDRDGSGVHRKLQWGWLRNILPNQDIPYPPLPSKWEIQYRTCTVLALYLSSPYNLLAFLNCSLKMYIVKNTEMLSSPTWTSSREWPYTDHHAKLLLEVTKAEVSQRGKPRRRFFLAYKLAPAPVKVNLFYVFDILTCMYCWVQKIKNPNSLMGVKLNFKTHLRNRYLLLI
jgi:hypothetical protein